MFSYCVTKIGGIVCHCFFLMLALIYQQVNVTGGYVASAWSQKGWSFLHEHVVGNTSGTIGAGAPVVLKAHLLSGWARRLLTLPRHR